MHMTSSAAKYWRESSICWWKNFDVTSIPEVLLRGRDSSFWANIDEQYP